MNNTPLKQTSLQMTTNKPERENECLSGCVSSTYERHENREIQWWRTNGAIRKTMFVVFGWAMIMSSGAPFFLASILQHLGGVSNSFTVQCTLKSTDLKVVDSVNIDGKDSTTSVLSNNEGSSFSYSTILPVKARDQALSCPEPSYPMAHENAVWGMLYPFNNPLKEMYTPLWGDQVPWIDEKNEELAKKRLSPEELQTLAYTKYYFLYFGTFDHFGVAFIPYLLAFFLECMLTYWILLPAGIDEYGVQRYREFPNGKPSFACSIINFTQGIFFLFCNQVFFLSYKTPFYDVVYDHLRFTDIFGDLGKPHSGTKLIYNEVNGEIEIVESLLFLAFAWWFALLFADFCYYWWHRHAHQFSWMWSDHFVHHSSEDYNLTVTLRESSMVAEALIPLKYCMMILPLAVLGVPESFMMGIAMNDTLYMNQLHTEIVPPLPYLEMFMMTASLHRVHHSRSLRCLSKNYSSVFCIWDRLFGTYEPENLGMLGLEEEKETEEIVEKGLNNKNKIKNNNIIKTDFKTDSNNITTVNKTVNNIKVNTTPLSTTLKRPNQELNLKGGCTDFHCETHKKLPKWLIAYNNSRCCGRKTAIKRNTLLNGKDAKSVELVKPYQRPGESPHPDDYEPFMYGVIPLHHDWSLYEMNYTHWRHWLFVQRIWYQDLIKDLQLKDEINWKWIDMGDKGDHQNNENAIENNYNLENGNENKEKTTENQENKRENYNLFLKYQKAEKDLEFIQNLNPIQRNLWMITYPLGTHQNDCVEKVKWTQNRGIPFFPPLILAMFTKWTKPNTKCPPLSSKSKMNKTIKNESTYLNSPWKWYTLIQFFLFMFICIYYGTKNMTMKDNLIRWILVNPTTSTTNPSTNPTTTYDHDLGVSDRKDTLGGVSEQDTILQSALLLPTTIGSCSLAPINKLPGMGSMFFKLLDNKNTKNLSNASSYIEIMKHHYPIVWTTNLHSSLSSEVAPVNLSSTSVEIAPVNLVESTTIKSTTIKSPSIASSTTSVDSIELPWDSNDVRVKFSSVMNPYELFTKLPVFLGFIIDVLCLAGTLSLALNLGKLLTMSDYEREYRERNGITTKNGVWIGNGTYYSATSMSASEIHSESYILKMETLKHVAIGVLGLLFGDVMVFGDYNTESFSERIGEGMGIGRKGGIFSIGTAFHLVVLYLLFNFSLLAITVAASRSSYGVRTMAHRKMKVE